LRSGSLQTEDMYIYEEWLGIHFTYGHSIKAFGQETP
jgi:hypothetical protein